jgi:hypothetical protein
MNDTLTERLPLGDLDADELAAAQAAIQKLRDQKQMEAEDRERWEEPLGELAEFLAEGNSSEMAQLFIDRTRLCGWDEEQDERLLNLVIGLIEQLDLRVRCDRHGRPTRISPAS